MVTIPPDSLGVVTAHIGAELPENVQSAPYDPRFGHFTNVQAFLDAGGKRGVQQGVLPPGTYAIHPYAFEVYVVKDVDEKNVVFGKTSELTDAFHALDPYTVRTSNGTMIVVDIDGDEELIAQPGLRDDYELIMLAARIGTCSTIFLDVAVDPENPSGRKHAADRLRSAIDAEGFRPSEWSPVEFAARLLMFSGRTFKVGLPQVTQLAFRPIVLSKQSERPAEADELVR